MNSIKLNQYINIHPSYVLSRLNTETNQSLGMLATTTNSQTPIKSAVVTRTHLVRLSTTELYLPWPTTITTNLDLKYRHPILLLLLCHLQLLATPLLHNMSHICLRIQHPLLIPILRVISLLNSHILVH